MEKNVITEVFCPHCQIWVRSGISFGGYEAYKGAVTNGNSQSCPRCGNMISMDKSNTRFAETKGWEKVYVEQKEKI